MNIYVASSWRNEQQPEVVRVLREAGHEVYDYRHPYSGNEGFHWSEIDLEYKDWNSEALRHALWHPIATHGFLCDSDAMRWADVFVLVLPCGRSAHLEAGWAIGQRKPTVILLDDHPEPELMYRLASYVAVNLQEVVHWVDSFRKPSLLVGT